jgi:hypothetical protein
MEELLKGLAGLKTEIQADTKKIIEAEKQGLTAQVADLEKGIQAKVDAALHNLEKSSEDIKKSIELSETEFKKQIAQLENNQVKDVSLTGYLTKSLIDAKDSLEKMSRGDLGGRLVVDLIKDAGTMTTANSIAGITGSAPTSAEIFAINNNKLIDTIARRQVHMRNILGMGTTDDSVFPYLIEKAKEGTVGVQNPEGSAKAEIENKFQLVTANSSTIAAVQVVGRQTLRNVRGLATVVQALMMNDLLIAEDNEILNGTGTNGRIQGIIPVATAPTSLSLSVAFANDSDVVAGIAAELAKNDLVMDFYLINPVNYWGLITDKNDDKDYLRSVMFDRSTSQLYVFGIPVFPFTGITIGSFLGGASRYAMPMQYQGITMRIDEFGQTNTKNNTVMIRVEEEILQAVTKPTAFYAGTIAAAKAALAPST